MEDEELEYRKILNILVVIKNVMSLICFTILAIVFKNFWIVFGALIFTSYVGNKEE
jgi:hypothetical protein